METFGCTCGRLFGSKSARTRHANRCPEVLAYRERVAERMHVRAMERQAALNRGSK